MPGQTQFSTRTIARVFFTLVALAVLLYLIRSKSGSSAVSSS